jgi:glutamate synthase (NADPH/NADH) large chain
MQPHRKHLKEIIEKHYENTKSPKSKQIFEDFDRFEPHFWLVSPAALNIQDLLKATRSNAA